MNLERCGDVLRVRQCITRGSHRDARRTTARICTEHMFSLLESELRSAQRDRSHGKLRRWNVGPSSGFASGIEIALTNSFVDLGQRRERRHIGHELVCQTRSELYERFGRSFHLKRLLQLLCQVVPSLPTTNGVRMAQEMAVEKLRGFVGLACFLQQIRIQHDGFVLIRIQLNRVLGELDRVLLA